MVSCNFVLSDKHKIFTAFTQIMENLSFQLEACVNCFHAARIAEQAGADRIELCENLHAGGTTPSAGTIKQVKARLQIPLYVMIRPRGGDFCYDEEEFAIMQTDIALCKNLGCEGVVFGILKENGEIDVNRCRRLVELAWPMETTFHRAFDLCPDPRRALEELVDAGFQYILTSGQQVRAVDGIDLLVQLDELAGGRIQLIAAGGIRYPQLQELLTRTHLRYFHSGASVPMPAVFPGSAPFALSDILINGEEIERMKTLLREYTQKQTPSE